MFILDNLPGSCKSCSYAYLCHANPHKILFLPLLLPSAAATALEEQNKVTQQLSVAPVLGWYLSFLPSILAKVYQNHDDDDDDDDNKEENRQEGLLLVTTSW